jgi:hypothetical protein
MKKALMLMLLLTIGCAAHQYDPTKFKGHFRHLPGSKGMTAHVDEAFRFDILFTGPLPTVPVCMVTRTSIYRTHEEIKSSCGMLQNRMMQDAVIFTITDYMSMNPPPRQDIYGVGESEQVLPYSGADVTEGADPSFRLIIEFYYAEPNEYGVLVKTKKFHRISSRPLRLDCRQCTW